MPAYWLTTYSQEHNSNICRKIRAKIYISFTFGKKEKNRSGYTTAVDVFALLDKNLGDGFIWDENIGDIL
jgi:hypothetical protein